MNAMRADVFYGSGPDGYGWQVRLFLAGEPAEQFGLDWPVQPQAGNPARDEAERELSRRGWAVGPRGWSGDILTGRSWAEVISAQHSDRAAPGSDLHGVTCQPAQPGRIVLVLPLARVTAGKPRGTGELILDTTEAEALAGQLRRIARRMRGTER